MKKENRRQKVMYWVSGPSLRANRSREHDAIWKARDAW